jgi:hypothetical protein
MLRFRFEMVTALSVVFLATILQSAWSEEPTFELTRLPSRETNALPKKECTCTIYSLAEFDDPSLGKWLAETIPQVIQPGTWNQPVPTEGTTRIFSYLGAGSSNILVVYHTPAVQAKVQAFLDNLKKTLPQEKDKLGGLLDGTTSRVDTAVVPAKMDVPEVSATEDRVKLPPSGYPVPAARKQPKHLFHFIIRYEGEGIVDDTVAGVLKELYKKTSAEDESQEDKPKSVCPATSASCKVRPAVYTIPAFVPAALRSVPPQPR